MSVPTCSRFQSRISAVPKYLFSFGPWLFEENEWIQDQEPFWRNLSLFEDYDFFILYKACRESYMLALGGPAYQCIPGGDIGVIKPGRDITVFGAQIFKINRRVENFPVLLRESDSFMVCMHHHNKNNGFEATE